MDAKQQALANLERAAGAAATAARGHLERGAHPDAVALGLLGISDGLPEGARAAQARELTTGLADDSSKVEVAQAAVAGLTDDKSIAAVAQAAAKSLSDEAAKQLLAELQARFAAGGNSPTN